MATEIPAAKTVDRDVEQEEFRKLLTFQDDARLLIIHDIPGTGKSTLLRRLQYNCQWVEIPMKPAGIVDLDNNKLITPFSLVEKIRLSLAKLDFKQFDRFNNDRINKKSSAFSTVQQAFGGASFSGGQQNITGQSFTAQDGGLQTFNINAGAWSEAQEELASQECVKAFFQDLKTLGDQQTLVLMLDHYERAFEDLQTWIRDNLIFPLCFDQANRPAKLMLVLAGRKNLVFDILLSHPVYGPYIRSKTSLRFWTDAHVIALLKVHGKDGLTEEQMNQLVDLVKKGFPIGNALAMADGFIAMNG